MRSPDAIVIGAGPAGLFCADTLADRGARVQVLDSGHLMTRRWCPETEVCDCRSCYVLEGEGGAGGFSDGKLPFSLSRGTQMEPIFPFSAEPLLQQINQTVVDLAGPGVWYEPKTDESPFRLPSGFSFGTYPLRHVGSDGVRRWSTGMTERVRARGVKISYRQEVVGVGPGEVVLANGNTMRAGKIIIASGIQGIPWSERILTEDLGVELEHGPAGIGIRVETPAVDMAPLFSRFYDWKIVYEPSYSPIVMRSFCCNQNGAIVNQYHRSMGIRGVNGHASLDPAERTKSSNFAIIAKIPTDYVSNPQEFVKSVARSVNSLTGGHTARQWLGEFVDEIRYEPLPSDPGWCTNAVMARQNVDIARAIPFDLLTLFREFILGLFEAVPSLNINRALAYAPELKYPAMRVPVDLLTWELDGHPGIYVIGDATGYIDSFVAAALSGIMAAQGIAPSHGDLVTATATKE